MVYVSVGIIAWHQLVLILHFAFWACFLYGPAVGANLWCALHYRTGKVAASVLYVK